MSSSETASQWTDELPVSGRAASNLADEYDSVDDLITAYREADDITDISYIGSSTMRDLREFIQERDPDAERVRNENDEAVCTEFTTDYEPDDADEDAFYFAFICPRCGHENPLKGEPEAFKNKPFGCRGCSWVSLLESDALGRFAEEVTA